MAIWKDIKPQNENFFEAEYIDIKEVLDKDIEVMDAKTFENDKGEGVALLVALPDGEQRSVITHSIGICKAVKSEGFMRTLATETIWIVIKEGKSKKSGKYFYYIE